MKQNFVKLRKRQPSKAVLLKEGKKQKMTKRRKQRNEKRNEWTYSD